MNLEPIIEAALHAVDHGVEIVIHPTYIILRRSSINPDGREFLHTVHIAYPEVEQAVAGPASFLISKINSMLYESPAMSYDTWDTEYKAGII